MLNHSFKICSRSLNFRFYFPSGSEENINTESKIQNKDKISEDKRNYYTQNKEKIKEAKRKYYRRNKDKIKESKREYYLQNKEKVKENNKEYKFQNKDKVKEYEREYRIQNKDKVKEHKREYYIQNKEKFEKRNKEYRIHNKDKIMQYNREFYTQNKEKIRELNIKKNIARNNGNYVPKLSWQNSESSREYFESIAPLLHISDFSDWYRISRTQIMEMGGRGMFSRFNSLGEALNAAYPEYDWNLSKFSFRGKRSIQRWLYVKLKNLIPNTTIFEEFYHPDLSWEDNKSRPMQLDIWVPELKLALEYQGEHHYFDIPGAFGPGSTTQIFNERDEKKKQICAEKGILLVSIPYWWDGKEDSLSSTLHQTLPNVFHNTNSPPIPDNLPTDYVKKKVKSTKSVQVKRPVLMQGFDWNNENPKGWYMSEKLDGIRAYWDGTQFYSKTGKIINVPEWFKTDLPSSHLDGELWASYINTERLNLVVQFLCGKKKHVPETELRKFKFYVFDAPQQKMNYQERQLFLQNLLRDCPSPFVSLIPIKLCLGLPCLQNYLQEITSKGGEGVMLYNPETLYEHGRTKNLLKVKTYSETDIKFLRCNPNSYSFICEQQNGKRCIVKCSGSDYSSPPPTGTVLTARHLGYFLSEKLKHPFLLRVRYDLNWNEVANEKIEMNNRE